MAPAGTLSGTVVLSATRSTGTSGTVEFYLDGAYLNFEYRPPYEFLWPTAKDLDGSGDVRGKTGEAEFEGGSHSWFAGYRGDMAFAALIVGGGSSEYAVRMLRGMFEQLPPDYLA